MEALHVISLERDGVEWHVDLREISRELSPTGLALVFSTAWGPRAESPILWPVATTLLEDLLDSIQTGGVSRLEQELEAALRLHGAPQESASSGPESAAPAIGSSGARECAR
jgi:hypothetical protein